MSSTLSNLCTCGFLYRPLEHGPISTFAYNGKMSYTRVMIVTGGYCFLSNQVYICDELKAAKAECIQLRRQLWRFQKQKQNTQLIIYTNKTNETTRTPLSRLMSKPVRRGHDLMREHGLSPMKNKKIRKCLTRAEILLKDALTTSTSSTKQRISSNKLGRFASQRQTYRGKYA